MRCEAQQRPSRAAGNELAGNELAGNQLAVGNELEESGVGAYLDRLGLVRLQAVSLEMRLEEMLALPEPDPLRLERTASELMELLIGELRSSELDEVRRWQVGRQIDRLLRDFPELDRPEIRVVRLADEFNQLQADLFSWLSAPVETVVDGLRAGTQPQDPVAELPEPNRGANVGGTTTVDAVSQANALLARLLRLEQQVQLELTDLQRATPDTGDGPSAADGEFGRGGAEQAAGLLGLRSQLLYVGGWSAAYRAAIWRQMSTAQQKQFAQQWDGEVDGPATAEARQKFLTLLGMNTVEDLLAAQADELGLEVPWISRSVLGLACLANLDREDPGPLLGLLRGNESGIQSELRWWELQFLCLAGDWNGAAERFSDWLAAGSSRPVTADLSLVALAAIFRQRQAVEREGLEAAGLREDEIAVTILERCAVQNLCRLEQFALVKRLQDAGQLQLPRNCFADLWFRSWLRFENLPVEPAARQRQLELAELELENALAQRQDWITESDFARCRYLLGWVNFRSEDYGLAATHWQMASREVRNLDPQLAAKAQWLRISALKRVPVNDPRTRDKQLRVAIEELLRLHPESEYAGQAQLELARVVGAAGDVDAAIDSLEAFGAEHPSYELAQLEVFKLIARQLQAAPATREMRLDLLDRLEKRVRQFSATSGSPVARQRAIGILVLAQLETPDYLQNLVSAERWLQRGQNIELDGAQVQPASEFHFARFRWAALCRDTVREELASGQPNRAVNLGLDAQQLQEIVEQEARWLVQSGHAPAAYQILALIDLLKQLEASAKSAVAEEQEALLLQEYEYSQQLSGLLGTSEQSLRANANARVIYFRLAELESGLGKPEQATRRLLRLCEWFPTRKAYLRQLALVYLQQQQGAAALPWWEKLEAIERVGSAGWLEAKLEIVSLQADSPESPATAGSLIEVLDQALLLSPQAPLELRQRCEELKRELQSPSGKRGDR